MSTTTSSSRPGSAPPSLPTLHSTTLFAFKADTPTSFSTNQYPHHPHRKNSLELFLSQSPSQSLGSSLMKMHLEPKTVHPPPSGYAYSNNTPPVIPMVPTSASGSTHVYMVPASEIFTARKKKSCKFFLHGHCRMGNKCKFTHERFQASANNAHLNPSQLNPLLSSCTSNKQQEHSIGDLETEVTLNDIQGKVVLYSKDQNGCRLLQEQLGPDREVMLAVVVSEVMPYLDELMIDPFGNYLFQKIIDFVSDEIKTEIVTKIASHLVTSALNLHGTRSVQKVVECCTRFDQRTIIAKALSTDVVRLCIDSNGNHVIQRTLQFMTPNFNQFVFNAVAAECTTVGTHRHGCCVLQRCLDAANASQKSLVIKQVEKHAMQLMQDPYGNYVVQYVLDSCSPAEAAGVISTPLGHLFELSIQKFSSNVIEKCLEQASLSVKARYISEITLSEALPIMLQDQFANYVVQRALSVCTEKDGMKLVMAILPHLEHTKNTSGGRRITARILKRFPSIVLEMNGPPVGPYYGDGASLGVLHPGVSSGHPNTSGHPSGHHPGSGGHPNSGGSDGLGVKQGTTYGYPPTYDHGNGDRHDYQNSYSHAYGEKGNNNHTSHGYGEENQRRRHSHASYDHQRGSQKNNHSHNGYSENQQHGYGENQAPYSQNAYDENQYHKGNHTHTHAEEPSSRVLYDHNHSSLNDTAYSNTSMYHAPHSSVHPRC